MVYLQRGPQVYKNLQWMELDRYVITYVNVNLCNEAIRELPENFRQFVKCLFKSVNLFFYACKTLKTGLFWYAVEREPVRLESTNPKKKFPDPGCSLMGGHSLHQKKIIIYIFFWWRASLPTRVHPRSGNFFQDLWTLASSVLAQRHTRIGQASVFCMHRKIN